MKTPAKDGKGLSFPSECNEILLTIAEKTSWRWHNPCFLSDAKKFLFTLAQKPRQRYQKPLFFPSSGNFDGVGDSENLLKQAAQGGSKG